MSRTRPSGLSIGNGSQLSTVSRKGHSQAYPEKQQPEFMYANHAPYHRVTALSLLDDLEAALLLRAYSFQK